MRSLGIFLITIDKYEDDITLKWLGTGLSDELAIFSWVRKRINTELSFAQLNEYPDLLIPRKYRMQVKSTLGNKEIFGLLISNFEAFG